MNLLIPLADIPLPAREPASLATMLAGQELRIVKLLEGMKDQADVQGDRIARLEQRIDQLTTLLQTGLEQLASSGVVISVPATK